MDPEDFDDRRAGYLSALRRTGSQTRATADAGITSDTVQEWRTDQDFERDERLVLDDLEVQNEIADLPAPPDLVPIETLAEEYRSGFTIEALSLEHGIPEETIRGRLKRARVKRRAPGPKRTCRVEGCKALLRRDNRSGFCSKHSRRR